MSVLLLLLLGAGLVAGASGREVGAAPGDSAEYDCPLDAPAADAHAVIRYSRAAAGDARFAISARAGDEAAPRAPVHVLLPSTAAVAAVAVPLGPLPAGRVSIRIERPGPEMTTPPESASAGADPLLLLGGRADKGTLGGGEQVAAYARENPQVSYATNSLGPVFSPLRGRIESWRPDRVVLVADDAGGGAAVIESAELREGAPPGVALARRAAAPRRFELSLTADDVLLARTMLRDGESVTVSGDFAESREWRGSPGGSKTAAADADGVTVRDENVFPAVVARVAASAPPARVELPRTGAYALTFDRPGTLVVACALARDEKLARSRLARALAAPPDPLEAVTRSWREWFATAVPFFDCSDRRLEELYWFRFYLLRTATCGGGLGRFEKRVVLEGRDAYQTFCCFSAPFLARDLAWARDGDWAGGTIETLAANAYEDGRFPWYTSPRTNRVPLHHASATGNSFLAAAAWDHYLVHRDVRLLEAVYEPLARNLEWWRRERGRGGLFAVEDLLETGMDDLARGDVPLLAVDATSYAALNARALGAMAHALGRAADSFRFEKVASEIAAAVAEKAWSEERGFFFDAGAQHKRVRTVAGFYPFFAEIAEPKHARALDALLDEEAFDAPFPIPALARGEAGFDPRSFWMGPSWPATTCHALHGAAWAARHLDRSRRDAVAALFMKCVSVLFTPRIDFYERYDPLTGEGLSRFRDYMHSFWIDLVVRHVIGLEPREEGTIVLDPLPIPVDAFRVRDLPYAGRKLEISWQAKGSPRRYPDRPVGFSLSVDGETVAVRETRERIEHLP